MISVVRTGCGKRSTVVGGRASSFAFGRTALSLSGFYFTVTRVASLKFDLDLDGDEDLGLLYAVLGRGGGGFVADRVRDTEGEGLSVRLVPKILGVSRWVGCCDKELDDVLACDTILENTLRRRMGAVVKSLREDVWLCWPPFCMCAPVKARTNDCPNDLHANGSLEVFDGRRGRLNGLKKNQGFQRQTGRHS